MPVSFDLTTHRWIPCERLDGVTVELSTREVLVRAHELRAIVDAPLVVAALHRHLLAVLHRTYDGPRTTKAWGEIVRAGRFDEARLDAYLAKVRDRMDLFHATHPFAQARGLVQQFTVDPIDQLEIERSSWGPGRALFQHRPADYRAAMTPAQAARGLLAHHAFATGGLVKKPGEPTSASAAPLVRAAVVLLRGETLFKTLVSNLLRYDPAEALPIPAAGTDLPSWEQEPPPRELRRSDEPKRMPLGWLDLLTWQSRRLELVCEGEIVAGYVRAVYQGLRDDAPRDPMVTWRQDDKRGWVSVGIDPGRAFWRHANALFQSAGTPRTYLRPQAVDLVASREARGYLAPRARYTLDVFGLAADKSRIDLVRVEHVHGLAESFDDPDARESVERALASCELVVGALRSALWTYGRHALGPGQRAPETKDVSAFVRSLGAEPATWSALGVEFDALLRNLDAPIEARARFDRAALGIARDQFAAATAGDDRAGRWPKARALAERKLHRELAPLYASTRADEARAHDEATQEPA